MPAESVPAIILVVAMFVTFMVALGGAAFWSSRPQGGSSVSRLAQHRQARPPGDDAGAH